MIESKTGLKLKKQKKTIYFNGLLYQFTLLNELLSTYPEVADETESTAANVELSSSKNKNAETLNDVST